MIIKLMGSTTPYIDEDKEISNSFENADNRVLSTKYVTSFKALKTPSQHFAVGFLTSGKAPKP